MKFWDSSAIIPLLVPEPESKRSEKLLSDDPEIIVWGLSTTEIHSSLYRKVRENTLKESELTKIFARLSILESAWSEIIQFESVRRKAHRLLAIHSLRAADSLQLASALVAFDEKPEGKEFVTFDKNLALAARREGFNVCE